MNVVKYPEYVQDMLVLFHSSAHDDDTVLRHGQITMIRRKTFLIDIQYSFDFTSR
jgi:hypothetical protein